ncbi:glycosyltransferase family 4 protein [uncultured Pelagimonas sp.]|uniref:glycosyltransferase family 4 protein n=1 Tax=uncultured Pelagimonas sp. TaxID=1618102 RepID=UPI00262C8DAB|nr:glycosyltransferase family 4 protein [uncultured Pelagimonas sp.]
MAPTILLITKDAPTPDRRKAGLFPVAIRQHLGLKANILLFAIEDGLSDDASPLSGFPDLTYLNQTMQPTGRLVSKSRFLANELLFRQLARIAKEHNVDAVMGLQSAPRTGLLAQRVANVVGCPFASWEHLTSYGRTDVGLNDRALRAYFAKANAVAAVSGRTLRAIEKRYDMVLEAGVTIPNPVPDDFEALPRPKENNFADHTNGFFTFGAWTNWRDIKRLDLLLSAFATVAAQRPNAKLIVAGPIPDKMGGSFETHPASDRIVRLGNVSREDIRHLAYAVDCCCLPSDHETFGLPVVEALAAGKPVVSTNTDGPSEILGDHPWLGHLVPKGDASAFAEAMTSVMDEQATYSAEKLRKHAIDVYGQKSQTARWTALYASMGLSV